MASYEPDVNAYDEVRYEEHREHVSSGLCQMCRNDQAMPTDVICESCAEECLGDVLLEEMAEEMEIT